MTNPTPTRRTPRPGFTLVEMLVSTALIIFLMVILTNVFSKGIQALRNLRGVGHLQEELRYAANLLRRDLAAPHFGRDITTTAGPNLSQQRLDLYDWKPPRQGFFRIYQGTKSVVEGTDADNIGSFVANNHYLHFTTRTEPQAGDGSGKDMYMQSPRFDFSSFGIGTSSSLYNFSRPDYLSDTTNYLHSPWAEVAYFVRPSGQTAGGTPLQTLYRRKRLVIDSKLSSMDVPAASILQLQPTSANNVYNDPPVDVSIYPGVGGSTPPKYLNTAVDIRWPFRRLGMQNFTSLPPTPPVQCAGVNNVPNSFARLMDDPLTVTSAGDDILLENVLSFEIKSNWDVPVDSRLDRQVQGVLAPLPFQNPTTGAIVNSDAPFDDLPLSPSLGNPNQRFGNDVLASAQVRVFDTWSDRDYRPAAGINYPYSQWNVRYENGGNATAGLAPVTIPLRIRVKAIQVRIRVWDPKTQQTRQITVVQDL